MTLTGLRYFVALAEEQHFGKAAERCHVSQPTLSAGIKRLEDEVGMPLFERARSGVKLTLAAEPLVNQARRVLEQARDFTEMARQQGDPLSGTFRLGAIHTVGPYLFPSLIPALLDNAPDMPIVIEEGFTADLRVQLRQGEIDAAIVALPFKEVDVVCMPLYNEPFELLMGQGHPLTQQEVVSKDDIVRDDLLLLGDGHCLRDQILDACPAMAERLQPKRLGLRTEGSSLETLRHMVAGGLGVTVLPSSAIGEGHYRAGKLTHKPFKEDDMRRTVAIAWRASFPRPAAVALVADTLKALAGNINASPVASDSPTHD